MLFCTSAKKRTTTFSSSKIDNGLHNDVCQVWTISLPPSRTDNTHQTFIFSPQPDGPLMTVDRSKIQHYRRIYLDHPDPIAFIPLTVDTKDGLYDELIRRWTLKTVCMTNQFIDFLVRKYKKINRMNRMKKRIIFLFS